MGAGPIPRNALWFALRSLEDPWLVSTDSIRRRNNETAEEAKHNSCFFFRRTPSAGRNNFAKFRVR
jgi:hypothetical protein